MDEVKTPESEPFRLKVKYNHEEIYLPEEEAAALAQKGMNYDKLQKSYEDLKSDKSAETLDELSKDYGFATRAEFLEELKKGTEKDPDGDPGNEPDGKRQQRAQDGPIEFACDEKR